MHIRPKVTKTFILLTFSLIEILTFIWLYYTRLVVHIIYNYVHEEKIFVDTKIECEEDGGKAEGESRYST